MTKDFEQFFIWIFAIGIPYWWGVWYHLLLIFKLHCLSSYCWVIRVLCYILDISTLSYMCFASIFSHSVACLLILLRVSFVEQKYILLASLSHGEVMSFFFLFAFCEFHGFLTNRIWNVKLGQFFVPNVKKQRAFTSYFFGHSFWVPWVPQKTFDYTVM